MEINEGMSADDVLKALGRPRATEVVGDEGKESLVVEWTYKTIRLTLARREVGGVTCYRVIKVEGNGNLDL